MADLSLLLPNMLRTRTIPLTRPFNHSPATREDRTPDLDRTYVAHIHLRCSSNIRCTC